MMLWRTPLTRTVHEICDVACHIFPRAKYYPRYHKRGPRKCFATNLASIVRRSCNTIHKTNLYTVDNGKRFAITYPLGTYLSVGWLYPLFIQLRLDPGIFFLKKNLRFDRSKKDYSISKTGDECLSENNYQPAVVRCRHCQKQVVPGKLMSCLH